MNPTALAPTTNQKSMLTAANMHGPCKIAVQSNKLRKTHYSLSQLPRVKVRISKKTPCPNMQATTHRPTLHLFIPACSRYAQNSGNGHKGNAHINLPRKKGKNKENDLILISFPFKRFRKVKCCLFFQNLKLCLIRLSIKCFFVFVFKANDYSFASKTN